MYKILCLILTYYLCCEKHYEYMNLKSFTNWLKLIKGYWSVCFWQGIVFLVENELLRHTPEDIAQFLYKGEGLNKTAIGDYLGERYSSAVLNDLLVMCHSSSKLFAFLKRWQCFSDVRSSRKCFISLVCILTCSVCKGIMFLLFLYLFFRDDFNIKVLQAFVDLHEFTDLNLVQALRWVNEFVSL